MPFCTPLPLSSIIYKASERRIGLLGSHNVRLIASFYSSAAILDDELRALAAEKSATRRKCRAGFAADELEQLYDFGDAALRGLRPFIEPRRVTPAYPRMKIEKVRRASCDQSHRVTRQPPSSGRAIPVVVGKVIGRFFNLRTAR